jgi:hypothetical protein
MSALPASAGWRWIKDGLALFRLRPGQFSMLFTTYLLILIVVSLIPVVGNLVQPFLAPTFSMVFMTACAQIARDGQLNPLQLRASFESPVSRRLLILGGVYLGTAVLLVLAVLAVFSVVGGGPFLELLTNNQDLKATNAQNGGVLLTMLAFFLIFMPAFWFAAPLIVWQKMPVFKALFYSFFSVLREFRAFLVYFLSWLMVGVIIPSILAGLLAMIIGKGFAMLLLFMLSILLTIVMYCSFYPTYVAVFGKPELPESPAPDLP